MGQHQPTEFPSMSSPTMHHTPPNARGLLFGVGRERRGLFWIGAPYVPPSHVSVWSLCVCVTSLHSLAD